MKLLKVDTIKEVQDKFEQYFSDREKQTESVELQKASGRYLAEDVFADMNSPSFLRSVVDGYAVKGSDTVGVSESMPVFLNLIGTVEMGKPVTLVVESGETVYVPTGGMLPEGSDAMVMVEHTETLGNAMIGILRPAATNSNIMKIGDDFKEGEKFFSKGHRIRTKDIGLLAACGKAVLSVYKKPVLTILSTGDELVETGAKPGPCEIRDINSLAIAAFAESAGAEIRKTGIVRDHWEEYRAAVVEAMAESDVVVLSGGSSAGNKDMTAKIIDSLGEPGVITHGLAIKPGKPTVIGIFKERETMKAVVGLPGHPLSAIIVFDVVVNGFLRKYYFNNEENPRMMTATMGENVHAGEGRETYQLVNLKRKENGEQENASQWTAIPIRAKSGAIAQLAKADGYVVVPAEAEGIHSGQIVDVILMEY